MINYYCITDMSKLSDIQAISATEELGFVQRISIDQSKALIRLEVSNALIDYLDHHSWFFYVGECVSGVADEATRQFIRDHIEEWETNDYQVESNYWL